MPSAAIEMLKPTQLPSRDGGAAAAALAEGVEEFAALLANAAAAVPARNASPQIAPAMPAASMIIEPPILPVAPPLPLAAENSGIAAVAGGEGVLPLVPEMDDKRTGEGASDSIASPTDAVNDVAAVAVSNSAATPPTNPVSALPIAIAGAGNPALDHEPADTREQKITVPAVKADEPTAPSQAPISAGPINAQVGDAQEAEPSVTRTAWQAKLEATRTNLAEGQARAARTEQSTQSLEAASMQNGKALGEADTVVAPQQVPETDGSPSAKREATSGPSHTQSLSAAGERPASEATGASTPRFDAQIPSSAALASAPITFASALDRSYGFAPTTPDTGGVPLSGVAVEIAARASEGKKRFEIRLDPPELGRIDVRLDVSRDGSVSSRLVVERAETLDMLRRDAGNLERALQSAGLNTSGSGLEFSLRDGSGHQHAMPENLVRADVLIVPDDDVAVAEAVRRAYSALRGLGAGVDMQV